MDNTIKMMKYKKLDGRNLGYGYFKYYVVPLDFKKNARCYFHEMREWCWNTWGSSKELCEWVLDEKTTDHTSSCKNSHWSWQNDDYYRRIYLRTDEDFMFFKLRWE